MRLRLRESWRRNGVRESGRKDGVQAVDERSSYLLGPFFHRAGEARRTGSARTRGCVQHVAPTTKDNVLAAPGRLAIRGTRVAVNARVSRAIPEVLLPHSDVYGKCHQQGSLLQLLRVCRLPRSLDSPRGSASRGRAAAAEETLEGDGFSADTDPR